MRYGNVQGDGRKFLERFKSYFGSQISSRSLNDSQNPQQKVIYFIYIFVLDCFESASRITNDERSRRSAAM